RGQFHDEILDHLKDRKGLDKHLLAEGPNEFLTRKATDPVDPHPVRTADAVTARHAKGERRVLLPADAIEAIEKPVEGLGIDLVAPVVRPVVTFRIIAENLESHKHVTP